MSIILDRLTKRYGSQTIVDQVSLEVADGELFVLLGASGSGKSTILRLIAGLLPVDGGRILLHGNDVTHLSPQQRGTGFVFQNYSIFRHMSIAENIEFGLKIRKMPRAERARRRDELLDLVGLAGLGHRYAHQISGGQQQRVALARALAYEPSVLLLDEPFGALDVKIRAQLRRSLKHVQQQLGVTTIMVTHDQEEAFELANRIGVVERGQLLEVGEAEALYTRPQTSFVATFLGAGTVLVGRVEAGQARFGSLQFPIPANTPHEDGIRTQILFRPEQVVLSETAPPDNRPVLGQGTIIEQTFAGSIRRLRLRLPRLDGVRQIAPRLPFGEENLLIDVQIPADTLLSSHNLWVTLRGWHILTPPQPRLLLYDTAAEPYTPLALAQNLSQHLDASVTTLGVAADSDASETLSDTLKRRQQETGLKAELRIRQGNPLEQIANEQAETLYEMLILAAGSQSDGRLNELVQQVLERMNAAWAAPVLVVKGDRTTITHILICTAAGEPGKSDVRAGGRLARRLRATATLLYVTREREGPSERACAHLERATATLRALDVASTIRTRPAATPVEGILAEAHAGNYDLIVIGSHGPVARSVFGRDDVALQVVAKADRPVLVVPYEAP
jgi:sulfate transport system ATP-binding protein